MRPFEPLSLVRRNPVDEAALYPWIVQVMPALRERFGTPRALLGGGMSGMAFDIDGSVVKVTLSPQEVEAVQRVVALRLEGAELPGLAHFDYGGPVSLGSVRGPDGPATAYAILKERVVPVDAAAVNRSVKMPRVVAKNDCRSMADGDYDADQLGTPFEFASETAQDWAEATKACRSKLLREYGRWTDEIAEAPSMDFARAGLRLDGFQGVAASMDEFLELTGIPLWDVRPENCGRSKFGTKQIVCYDFEVPHVRREVYRNVSRRPK